VVRHDRRRAGASHARSGFSLGPRPGVPEPERGQEAERRELAAAIRDRHTHEHVVRRGLGIFDEDVEVTTFVEDARIEDAVFALLGATRDIVREEPRIRKFDLWIFVERLCVGMSRGRVEIEILLLYRFAVVAFGRSEPEKTLFQDWIAFVPQRDREAEQTAR